MRDDWRPFVAPPDDLVLPVRLDPTGSAGPTRGQARGRRWRQCVTGWYVPSDVDGHRVEQRILEQGARLLPGEAVTGWAALRWRGARFFDLQGPDGTERPIPVIRRSGARPDPFGLVTYHRHQLAPYDAEVVTGLRCTTVPRATFDEMRFAQSVRAAVVAVDMVAAAGLITVRGLAEYAARRSGWEGVPQVRGAIGLAVERSASPQESRLRLVWVLDAGLSEPLCNVPVFGHDGSLLGYPDLLDPSVGLVVEYDGAHHKHRDRHRRDVAREQRFREHGLEYASVVGGDLRQRDLVVDRLLAAHRRARLIPSSARAWTLAAPAWWASADVA